MDSSYFINEEFTNHEIIQFVKDKMKMAGWSIDITEPRPIKFGSNNLVAEIICKEFQRFRPKIIQNLE